MFSKLKNTRLIWILILCSALSTLATTWCISKAIPDNPWFTSLFALTYFALTAGFELALEAVRLWSETQETAQSTVNDHESEENPKE